MTRFGLGTLKSAHGFFSIFLSQSSKETVAVFGQLPVALLLAMFAIFTGLPTLPLMTAHLVYFCRLTPSLCSSSTFFLWYQAVVLGCGSPPGPKGSANRCLVSAVPEVSGGKMKTNGGATTSGTACGSASRGV